MKKLLVTLLSIAIIGTTLSSCAAGNKYGCPKAKTGSRHDSNLRF